MKTFLKQQSFVNERVIVKGVCISDKYPVQHDLFETQVTGFF
jgi:hypothetical protein